MFRVSFLLMLLLLACVVIPGYCGPSKGRQDCSNTFKGRTIRMEYLYYKGSWLKMWIAVFYRIQVEYAARHTIFDHNKGMSWKLHDCGGGYVCIENMLYPSRFLLQRATSKGNLRQEYVSRIERDVTDGHRFEIWCDSCENHKRCQLYTKSGEALYTLSGVSNYVARLSRDRGYSNWYDWEIVLLVPMEQWKRVEVVASVCNHYPVTVGTHFENSAMVGSSTKLTETHGMSTEISAAFKGSALPWSYSFKATHRSEWSTERLQQSERRTSVIIRGETGLDGIPTPTNKKAVLSQLVGIYGEPGNTESEFRFKTNKLVTSQEDC